jgi:hypothetical protein
MTTEEHSFVPPGLITFVTYKLVSVLLFAVVFHLLPASFKFATKRRQFVSRYTNKQTFKQHTSVICRNYGRTGK